MFLLSCNGSRCIINMFKPADPSVKYILNALSQSTQMEISDLPLKAGDCGRGLPSAGIHVVASRKRYCRWGRGPNAAHLNIADLICMLFIGGCITWTAYKPVHLAVVAMDTRPQVSSLSSSSERDSPDVEMQVFRDIQWNIVLQRHSAKPQLRGTRIIQQAGIVLTQTPLLIWAGGNDVH